MGKAVHILKLARPHHWIKNALVLLPVLFARRHGDPWAWIDAGVALGAFCLASSFAYAINDVRDRHADRLHPKKKHRPLASGALSVPTALAVAAVLLVGSVGAAWAVNVVLAIAVGAYLLLQVGYSTFLKSHVLVDVICIALGFVLRAAGGAVAISEAISPWLFVGTFTVCLFMGVCKRRTEAAWLAEGRQGAKHRATLERYTPELLTHLITLSAGVAVVSYLQYAISPSTVAKLGTPYLVLTLPVVIYGIVRFAMLSMQGRYSDPVELLTKDRPMQASILVWTAMAAAIILWGVPLRRWVQSNW